MASENVISPGGLAPSKHYHRQNTAVTISTLPAETVSGSGKLRCPLCPNLSARSQERKRHVHLHLPCCVFCPEQDCLWRGDRKDTLQGHLGRKHGISGKFDKAHYIYDAKELVTKLIDGDITLSEATKRAKTGVYAKAEAVETAKAVEWKRDFRGPKRKVLE
ncbi:hypothetical protein BC834DRAFT_97576 [Gloeopeniophorella convolvens]|nr:hypothetical protein BC834DRAFT_97576 [Gloeopeniophorella convolvens]